MKKLLTLMVVITFSICASSQVPEKMSYQAVIRNSSDQLVTSHAVGMRISILQGSATGTPVYVETQTPNTNANGLVSLEIGGGTIVTGTFSGINWSTGVYFIKTETDLSGGTSYTITGTSQLLSVPYALYAKTADNVDGMKQQIKILEDNLIAAGTYKLSDIEGNQYNVVKIGSQVWMKENLKTAKYNDNTPIPYVTDNTVWSSLSTPAYCWYNNDAATYEATTYGALYNWYSINTGKLCPKGWHVPSLRAFEDTLITYAGGGNTAFYLMETGTTHWLSPNTDATNATGFTALPSGMRYASGGFSGIGTGCSWWDPAVPLREGTRQVTVYGFGYDGKIGVSDTDIRNGFSVRCLKDN